MNLKDVLTDVALKYPQGQITAQMRDIERVAFHIDLVLNRKGRSAAVCDIGGGIGLFSVGCAALGMRAMLVDDCRDEVNVRLGESPLALHRSYGVEILSKDALADDLEFPAASFDAITCFESMEHWHHSPKRLFRKLKAALKPHGVFALSAPNCVDLKRRATVLFGRGKWSSMEGWYEARVFRGHVREPDVEDLGRIGLDMGLTDIQIFGRNWWPYSFSMAPVRFAAMALDRTLRVRPSLCSTIYLTGYA